MTRTYIVHAINESGAHRGDHTLVELSTIVTSDGVKNLTVESKRNQCIAEQQDPSVHENHEK
jgi:hypothetical protein